MRFFLWIMGSLTTLIIGAYITLFTETGNSFTKPFLQTIIEKELKQSVVLSIFRLTPSTLNLEIDLKNSNKISANGNFSVIKLSFNFLYSVEIDSLEKLSLLKELNLIGRFYTNGRVVGSLASINIDGKSDVAKSSTSYHIEMQELTPKVIVANIKNADLSSILALANKSPYASANLNVDVDLKNIAAHKLDGTISLKSDNGKIDIALMKKEFNITLAKTEFTMNLDVILNKELVKYSYIFDSNLANIVSSGELIPTPFKSNIKYSVDVKELALFEPLINTPLRGPFKTNGTVIGTKESMSIDGVSDIIESDTHYEVKLANFEPQSIIAKVKGAKAEKLLYMLKQPKLFTSDINLDIHLTSLNPQNLAGYLDMKMTNSFLNTEYINKKYKLNMPKTAFNSSSKFELKSKEVKYKTVINSNLAVLDFSGLAIPSKESIDLKYSLMIHKLSLLKPITGADLRGKFAMEGTLKGTQNLLVLDAKSNVASSQTVVSSIIRELKVEKLNIESKHLSLSKLLYMTKQDSYADGELSLDIAMNSLKTNSLEGVVLSSITKGLFNSRYMTKKYKFKREMPQTPFNLKAETKIHANFVDTKLDFNSDLATLDIKKAQLNLENSSLVSDYEIYIPKLQNFHFITLRNIKGGINIDGELKQSKNFDLTMHSNVVGGVVNAKLHNKDLVVNMNSLETLDILNKLYYPKMFRSSMNGVLNYNLEQQKGKLKANLVDGKFTQNQMLTLLKQFARQDMYAETFKGDLSASINREQILASLFLKSNQSSMKTTDTKINSKTNQMDSLLNVSLNGTPITVFIKGKTSSPDVSVDMKKLLGSQLENQLKSDTGKAITKEVNKFFKGFF